MPSGTLGGTFASRRHALPLLDPVSFSDAKKAGFTVLKKTGKGEYERQ